MPGVRKVLSLDEFEQRLLVSGMNDYRTDLIQQGRPSEDVSELILKIINAPTKKSKWRDRDEAR